MDIATLINAISGLVGGNILGGAWKDKSLGVIGNSIAGLVGGVAGQYILQAVGILNTLGMSDMTAGSLLTNIGSGVVSGGVLTAICGIIKSALVKKA